MKKILSTTLFMLAGGAAVYCGLNSKIGELEYYYGKIGNENVSFGYYADSNAFLKSAALRVDYPNVDWVISTPTKIDDFKLIFQKEKDVWQMLDKLDHRQAYPIYHTKSSTIEVTSAHIAATDTDIINIKITKEKN